MALKNLFEMVKADRYTQDGREELIKAQEAETEDVKYQNGDISQKTGLMKTPNGWVKPPKGKQPGAASKHDTDPQTYIVKKNDELRKMYLNEKDPAKKEAMKKALKKQASMMEPEPFSSTESKPDESARIAASKEARAKKSQELEQKAAGDFAKYKDLPPVQRKDALGAASHEGISIGMTQRSMEGMGWDLIQADDKVNVYGKPDGSKAIMKHDGKKITEVSYEAPGNKPAAQEEIGKFYTKFKDAQSAYDAGRQTFPEGGYKIYNTPQGYKVVDDPKTQQRMEAAGYEVEVDVPEGTKPPKGPGEKPATPRREAETPKAPKPSAQEYMKAKQRVKAYEDQYKKDMDDYEYLERIKANGVDPSIFNPMYGGKPKPLEENKSYMEELNKIKAYEAEDAAYTAQSINAPREKLERTLTGDTRIRVRK